MSLQTDLASYQKYHKNTINALLHFITIPMIVMTLFTLTGLLKFKKYEYDNWFYDIFQLNVTLIIMFLYFTRYLIYSIPIGLLTLFPIVGFYIGANLINVWIDNNPFLVIIICVPIHVICWIIQIIGHIIYEHNTPAFLDNLISSFFVAPLYVYLKLFFFFGFFEDLQLEILDVMYSTDPLNQNNFDHYIDI